MKKFIQTNLLSIMLIISLIMGVLLGLFWGKKTENLKPLGDIFLNLLFTAVVPLVFFSIASAVARMKSIQRLGKIMALMLAVFMVTGIIASLVMLLAVKGFPPAEGFHLALPGNKPLTNGQAADKIVRALTTTDFAGLLSRQNMLALIIFSGLVGLAAAQTKEKGESFRIFLESGSEVMLKLISYIMWYAPLGLSAYFAYLIGVFGPSLLGAYARSMAIFYPVSFLYFFAAFTLYAFFAGRLKGVALFWKNIIATALTALATGSSMASIPVNLEAASKNGIPRDISETVIPIGATIHMEGSCLSAILKIAFLFGIFNQNFSDPGTLATAVGIALLSGTVMSGIPGGGFIGELLIVTLYGFPPESLPLITMIGTLVDPPATMVNAVGDNVSSMMIARIIEGKEWLGRINHS